MINIIIGLCLLCCGIIGVVTNWWAVIDFIVVVIPVALVVVGVISIMSGIDSQQRGARR